MRLRSNDLRTQSAGRLNVLRGDRRRRHSLHLDDRRRVCSVCNADGENDVEIVDRH